MNPAGTVSTPQFPDLLARAVTEPGVIVGANHPSGDPPLSAADVVLCAQLRGAAVLLGLDFVIIGDGRYYSFQEMGR